MNVTRFLDAGGCGFIGTAFIKKAVELGHYVIKVDCLSYAGPTSDVADVAAYEWYRFEQVDIRNRSELVGVFGQRYPDAVIQFAAETHVDRGIDDPSAFVQTNIVGTFNLLEVSREHWVSLGQPGSFRFLHVSTNEVFWHVVLERLHPELNHFSLNSPCFGGYSMLVSGVPKTLTWFVTGTHSSLLDAGNYVRTLTERQGIQIGSPDEVAWNQGFISDQQLAEQANRFARSDYGCYLEHATRDCVA